MPIVLHHSVYAPLSHGHGGEKRTAQLYEQWGQEGLCVRELKLSTNGAVRMRDLWSALWLVLQEDGLCGWESSYRFLQRIKHVAIWLPQLQAFFSATDADTFYWESTREQFYILPILAKRYGKRVVAFPHNVESLVPNQKSTLFNRSVEEMYRREINILRQCDEVRCIAAEESWLLSLWGVKATFLPYELPKVVQAEMDAIREARKTSEKKYYLLLGSAINPPTRQGMEEVLQMWKRKEAILVVAGYGTEVLAGYTNETIQILGAVSQEKLTDILVGAKALIINQPPTTGALTRIEEFLQAGIPIYANESSVRSYWNRSGIQVYHKN